MSDQALCDANYDRGVAYRAKGDHGRAVADNEHAIRLEPIHGNSNK